MSKAAATWNDEIYAEMKQEYLSRMEGLAEEDRPKHSSEVVAEIAEANGFTLNAFRLKLSKEGVYIKKGPATSASKTSEGGAKTGGTRTSKAEAHKELIAAFTDGGVSAEDVDMSIIDKLTGKAAQHLTALVRQIIK